MKGYPSSGKEGACHMSNKSYKWDWDSEKSRKSRHGKRSRFNPGSLIPIAFFAILFGPSAIRFAIRIARTIFRAVTSGLTFGMDMLFDRSSIFGSVAIGVMIGLVVYYRRRKNRAAEEEEDEFADEEEDREPEAPFCPPIMTSTASDTSDDDYVPPMYHSSGR